MVGFIPIVKCEYVKFLETIESVRVLLLRVLGDSSSSSSSTIPNDSPKAVRGEVGTISVSPLISLGGYTLFG